MKVIGYDCETDLIGPENVGPPMVCATFAYRNEANEVETFGASTADGDTLHELLTDFLTDPDVHLVGQSVAFDFLVAAHEWEDLVPLIFQAYEDERIHDLPCREKCLNLSTFGAIDLLPVPSGKAEKIKYGLADMVMSYLGIDLSEDKDADDAWRLRYGELRGVPFADYPEAASQYAIDDALYALLIFECQEERVEGVTGTGSLATAVFHAAVDFALKLITDAGFPIDPEEKDKVETWVSEELTPEKLAKLLSSGVLRPGESRRPYKSKKERAKAAESLGVNVVDIEDRVDFDDDEVAAMEAAEVKLTKGEKQSINRAELIGIVEQTWKTLDRDPVRTDPSDLHPEGQISTASVVLQEIADHDPSGVLAEYQHRAALQKIVTTELPRMMNHETGETARVVHPDFDVMKATSRTSSYGGNLYPSFNCQNVDPRVRNCYVPEDGHVLCSIDYSGIELVSAAQTQLDLFGHSALADIINAGVDVHAYLGAQLAYHLHDDFKATCVEKDVKTGTEVYEAFLACKTHDDPKVRAFFLHWRTFAKPTGLGYPGGLGDATFVTYAKGSYGVEVTQEQSKQLKAIWLATFPEYGDYFQWITQNCVDPVNHLTDPDTGEIEECYAYSSPLGTYRAGCTFCQAANGRALQTPTAEGAKKAVFDVVRACFDETQKSILFSSQALAFIHDEMIMHFKDTPERHEKAFETAGIMVASMQPFVPDMTVKADPALMLRWDKRAETKYDADGRLDIWTPGSE